MTAMTEAPAALAFHGIEFELKEKTGPKHILRGVSGELSAGDMMCILGPSGCGKTSLINIIAHRVQSSRRFCVRGQVLCQGRALTPSQFQRIAGLVTQEDIFNATLSVRETLVFGAMLRLPPALRKKRVEEVISLLQLDQCASTKIGDASNPYLKGISGGEKRRLAIASEILDPNIALLVLDEPTSGLDAAAALKVVRLLHSFATTGVAVITTLHQPRPSIMSHFQQLMVMSKGRQVFQGPLQAYELYLAATLQFALPQNDSPYDCFLDALALGSADDHRANIGALSGCSGEISDHLTDIFANSDLGLALSASAHKKMNETLDYASNDRRESQSRATWLTQFRTIFVRTAMVKIRDPTAMMTQVVSALLLGLIFGGIYWDCYKKQTHFALLDVQMALSMSIIMILFLPSDAVLTFPKERYIFVRERKAGLYCSSALFLGRILADMPLHVLAAMVMAIIVHPMVGLNLGLHLWLLLNVCAILLGAAIMQTCGAICKSFDEANVLSIMILTLSFVLSGSFIREVPAWLSWARSLSVVGLLSDVTTYLEFRDSGLLGVDGIGSLDDIAEEYGLRVTNDEEAWVAIWLLIAIFFIARLTTFLGIKFLFTGRTFRENLWI